MRLARNDRISRSPQRDAPGPAANKVNTDDKTSKVQKMRGKGDSPIFADTKTVTVPMIRVLTPPILSVKEECGENQPPKGLFLIHS